MLDPSSKRILVLGAASWLGYLLLTELAQDVSYSCIGSLHRQKPAFPERVKLFTATSIADYEKALLFYQPTVIVNFLRGEDPEGLGIHRTVIRYCQDASAHYIYASSALALDGYSDVPLTEDLLANGVSPYGKFKAMCEDGLQASGLAWTILRFSSVHGYAPHKLVRTESFLRKLKGQELIKVDRGVVQNRMAVNVLIAGVQQIIRERKNGVFHFGTKDSSEEYYFLKKVAEVFGYAPEKILEGQKRSVNIALVPHRIIVELGKEYEQTEADTLHYLDKHPYFQKYKKFSD